MKLCNAIITNYISGTYQNPDDKDNVINYLKGFPQLLNSI